MIPCSEADEDIKDLYTSPKYNDTAPLPDLCVKGDWHYCNKHPKSKVCQVARFCPNICGLCDKSNNITTTVNSFKTTDKIGLA